MTEQDLSTPVPRRQIKTSNVNPLARSVYKVMLSGPVYKTSTEVHTELEKQGCQSLSRDEKKSQQMVRKVLIQNSSQYGRRKADDTFFLKIRLRELI